MHLKTLVLKGFKSFASTTTLRFEPGITCVVGPNGSGKSNVVDALAWVMGEQGAKTLRGGQMADVIFAGTSKRPALGRAEVSLTIDNSDGALPIDYTEVTITRTMFRTGGSEYAINGCPARLIDIQELLSDTGMGREMHVIIGQGRLDRVLHASAEERRGFIEEAAGILKHRRRKEKALRKLTALAENLERLGDLTTEIRRQLGPLARQAKTARRAGIVQAQLRDSRARLLADDIVQVEALLAADTVAGQAGNREIQERESQLESARAQVAQLEESAEATREELAQLTQDWHDLSSIRERYRSLEAIAAERYRANSAPPPQSARRDPEELEARAEAAAAQEEELTASRDLAAVELAKATEIRTSAESRERNAEHRLAALHGGIADRREGLAKLRGVQSRHQARLEALNSELERLEKGAAQARQSREKSLARHSELEREIVLMGQSEELLDAAWEKARAQAQAAREETRALTEAHSRETTSRDQCELKRDTLALSLAPSDAGAKILEHYGEISPGTLDGLLAVTPGYETAIGALLGAHLTAPLVPDSARAIEIIQRATTENWGSAQVLIQAGEGLAAYGTDLIEAAASACNNIENATPALEIVKPRQSQTQNLLEGALAGAVVVENIDQAQKIIEADWRLTAVTLEGETLSANCAANAPTGENGGLLSLRSQYEQAAKEAQVHGEKAQRLTFELARAKAELESAVNLEKRTLADLRTSDANYTALTEQLAALGGAVEAAAKTLAGYEPTQKRLREQIADESRALEEVAGRLLYAQKEPVEAQEELAQAQEQRSQCAALAKTARADETEARLQLRTLDERCASIAGRAQSLRSAANREREREIRDAQIARQRAKAAGAAVEIREQAQAIIEVIDEQTASALEERSAIDSRRNELGEQIERARARESAAGQELAKLRDVNHRREVERASVEARHAQLLADCERELGMAGADLVEEYGPHLPILHAEGPATPYSRAEQEKLYRAAKRELSKLGAINPLALEEHAALEERHNYLTEQVADIKKSRGDLQRIITDIDRRVEEVFTAAFADTQAQFEGVFARLFPGGRGRLTLTNPDDPLTTGIEIEARPAGKRVSRLSLLSGGERSLTAVALLVAIFKARPSPFYVMDEVEAALDDVNLGRLIEIFSQLRATSQLLIITHQKRTMEIADALYGVAMRGDGITRVISQRTPAQSGQEGAGEA